MDSNPARLQLRLTCLLAALLAWLVAPGARAGIEGIANPVTSNARTELADLQERVYIVEFAAPPALALPDISGRRSVPSGFLAGTVQRQRFDPEAAAVRAHVDALQAAQNAVLRSVDAEHKRVYSYRYAFNGVAVKLTRAQAARLQLRKDVKRIWTDTKRTLNTATSAQFLGLLDEQGGLRTDLGLQGEGIIIGVIDSGITPGHPSISPRAQTRDKPGICRSSWGENSLLGKFLCRRFNRPGPELYDDIPAHWRGTCEAGENFSTEDCNRKLLGARYYIEGALADGDFEDVIDINEFVSPADADGHGTHIASIAAGNEVEAEIFGRDIGRIAGVAPRARVAVYKACWLEPGGFRATCSVADLQAAIDQAVADGVDIINYSVGSLDDSLTDPDDIALLRAAEQGVLSVVSSGNSGPEPFTMEAPATTPWVLSVGASSRAGNRVAEGLRVNKPAAVAQDYESREAAFTPLLDSVGPVTGDLVLVDDGVVTTPDNEPGSVIDGCSPLQNDDAVSGNIAYIQRGGCDFDLKVQYAQDAGAVAVVVFSNDNPLQTMVGDEFGIDIPAVMIGQADGQLLRDRLASDEVVEITLDKNIFINLADTGNVMGSFSGRGPSLADSDFLKPDVVAPGVQILGGHTPNVANGFRGEFYQYLSGTSQSTPHVAGIAALIKEAYPDWTPAEIKSALMTTARQDIRKTAGGDAADPFDMGAGHVVPNSAIDPGLVYDVTTAEFDSYLCTIGLRRGTQADCDALVIDGLELDARDLNLPSVAVTDLVTAVEVTRAVRNVGPAANYSVSIEAPDGIDVVITPTTLSLTENGTAEFTVRFSSSGAQLDEWLFGSYTWANETHSVRSPFAIKPTYVAVTETIIAAGNSGTAPLTVDFGYTGQYTAVPFGLVEPCVLPDNTLGDGTCTNTEPALINNDPLDAYEFFDDGAVPPWITRLTIQRDATSDDFYFRVALYDELTAYDDDLDLYVFDCAGGSATAECESITLVGFSDNVDTATEFVEDTSLAERGPGSYIVDIHGYEAGGGPGGDGLTSKFCLYAWSLGPAAAGNLAITGAPATATAGTTADYSVAWESLGDTLWLGAVEHREGATPIGLTLIDINANGLPVQDPAAFTCP